MKYILSDYDYMCSAENQDSLLNIVSSLERYAGQKRCNHWCDLVRNRKYEELVTELIVDYYDLNYKKPNVKSTLNFEVPSGLMLNRAALSASNFVSDLIKFGQSMIEKENIERTDEMVLS